MSTRAAEVLSSGAAGHSAGAYLLRVSLFAVLYFGLARLADSVLVFVEAGEPVTPVWPPAGLALAGLLPALSGPRLDSRDRPDRRPDHPLRLAGALPP
jgi:hypothetical protein